MLPEDEAEFEDGSDPARLPHGWPKIRLVEEFSESDIIKHAENNGGAAPVPLARFMVRRTAVVLYRMPWAHEHGYRPTDLERELVERNAPPRRQGPSNAPGPR